MPFVMRDHPAWVSTSGTWLRAFGTGPGAWAVSLTKNQWRIHDASGSAPATFELPGLPDAVPGTLGRRLAELGAVARWRNPDLWDAIATAIIRQVIRADQARRLQQRFAAAHGRKVPTPEGTAYAMPDAQAVAELPADSFASLGLAFKQAPLQAAARAYLNNGARWQALPGPRLVEELQTVPRIGPWTAGAAVADWTNDFALYPYGDLAVRKWAATAAPDVAWPTNEQAFAARWRRIATGHLAPLTLFILAWGGRHGASP